LECFDTIRQLYNSITQFLSGLIPWGGDDGDSGDDYHPEFDEDIDSNRLDLGNCVDHGSWASFTIPLRRQRALAAECPTCSLDSFKGVYRNIKKQKNAFLSVESAVQHCTENALATNGLRNLLPCILRAGLPVIHLMGLTKEVLECQIAQEGCMTTDDLTSNPGMANLLIQAGRFETFIDMLLLPYDDYLDGNPASLFNCTAANDTEISDFSSQFIELLADNSDRQSTLSIAEQSQLASVGLEVPSKSDIERFADIWNRSLELWNDGIFSRNDYSGNASFFDLSAAAILVEAFQQARSRVREESFSGFGDAWLAAIEGQQVERARKVAGVCASVRIQIDQPG